MITEAVYTISKIYFILAGFFYAYSLYTGDLTTFAHVTGIVALLFLVSNIKWYFLK